MQATTNTPINPKPHIPGCDPQSPNDTQDEVDTQGDREVHFQHEPLDLEDDSSIRLIQISPTLSDDGSISCRMVHVGSRPKSPNTDASVPTQIHSELQQPPAPSQDSYSCLSYTWGDPHPECSIRINGRPFCVRKNLWDFFNIARTTETIVHRWLWIDAICINQKNHGERNHQVQQMGRIYSRACLVICWLGAHPAVSEDLRNIRAQPRSSYVALRWSQYWSRAWITQEVSLNPRILVIGGTMSMNLDVLFNATELRRSRESSPLQYILHYIGNRDSNWGLFNLLHHFQDREAMVPRDRIYSLLALCSEGKGIKVDYDASDEQVMRHTLEVCKDSICFCSAAIIAHALWSDSNSLPSLVEDTRPYVQATTSGFQKPSSSVWCNYCMCFYHSSGTNFDKSSDYVLCLGYLCRSMTGHLHLRKDTNSTDIIGTDYENRFTICEFNSHVDGVELVDLGLVGGSSLPMLRLSFHALIRIAMFGVTLNPDKLPKPCGARMTFC